MMRIALFLATNAAILVLISVVFQIFGIEGILAENGVDLNLQALLVMSTVIGFGGSFISLAMSKMMAKRGMGVQVIEQPRSSTEQWLVETVGRQAKQAGIGMPEVGVFDAPEPNAFATGMRRNSALVAVSTGLLQNMNSDEVEAVLGHEISHVANGDMVTMGLLQGVVNVRDLFIAHCRPRGRPGGLQDGTRLRAGLFHHLDRGAGAPVHPGIDDRHVVLAPARIPCRCGWRIAGRSPQDGGRPAGPATGA
jgi:heat shock protein HtpX